MTAVAKHKQVLDAVRDVIAALATAGDLDGFSTENIKVVWFPAAEHLKTASVIASWPTILISPYGAEDVTAGGTNIQDDYGYQCVITIVSQTDQALAGHIDKYLTWRERIIKAFHNKRLSAVSSIYRVVARPGNIADFATFQAAGIWASYITVVCTDRSLRG
jgi:hypothetical protein